MLASLALKGRELWRRNLAGDLPRPRFWPRQAVPLFWPLVLAGGLLLVLTLGRLVSLPFPGAAARQQEAMQPPSEAPAVRGADAESGEAAQGLEARPLEERLEDAPTAEGHPGPATPDPAIGGAPPEEASEAPTRETAPEDTGEAPGEPSPELMALASDDPGHLIAEAQADPAAGRLVLLLTPAFGPLGEEQRRRWAERWRERAESLGYEELELRSPAGRLLGRKALVGSGMILLEPERTR